MPNIKNTTVNISVDAFLEACHVVDLKEIEHKLPSMIEKKKLEMEKEVENFFEFMNNPDRPLHILGKPSESTGGGSPEFPDAPALRPKFIEVLCVCGRIKPMGIICFDGTCFDGKPMPQSPSRL